VAAAAGWLSKHLERPRSLRAHVRNHVIEGAAMVTAIVTVKAAIVSANVNGVGFWMPACKRDFQLWNELPARQVQQRVQVNVRLIRFGMDHGSGREGDLSVTPDPNAEPVAQGCKLVSRTGCSVPFSAAKRGYCHERIQR